MNKLLAAGIIAASGPAAGDIPSKTDALAFDRASAAQITAAGGDSLKKLAARLDAIAALPQDRRGFADTALALENALSDFEDETTPLTFMAYVSEDAAARDAAAKLEEQSGRCMVDVFTRKDLFEAVNAAARKTPALPPEDSFLMERLLLEFRRNGLALPPEQLEEFRRLKKNLVALELEFDKNIRDYKDHIEVSTPQLAGMGQGYTDGLARTADGKFIITMDYPDYLPFMDNAHDDDARKSLEFKFNNRCVPGNIALLEYTLGLRDRLAKMLGYKNHAEFVLEDRMAARPDRAEDFLERLAGKLEPKAKNELAAMRALRLKETGQDLPLAAWNLRYWDNFRKRAEFNVDSERLREYFPAEQTIAGMLDIFSGMFNVNIKPADLPAWSKDVKAYIVAEKAGEPLGYFYLDLYPRDGKYKHMACFPLRKGMAKPSGGYRSPAAAIVGNFSKPSAGAPALLRHGEVETLFHEFGHTLHNIFTKAKYASLSGTSVQRDFVETPSTLLENWVWEPEIIRRLSSHYKTGAKMPEEDIARLVASRNANSGMINIRQVFLSLLDMAYHTSRHPDTTGIYSSLQKKTMLVPMTEGTNPQAAFGHLMGGYDAGYYGYLWARVISADIFSVFKKRGITDPATGESYRKLILSTGRVPDENKQIAAFLGRPFREDAFISALGLSGGR